MACLVACVVLGGAGCGVAAEAGPPRAVTERFFAALAEGRAGEACALLARQAAEKVAEEEPCDRALAGLGLPAGGAVREVAVWGDEAQVRMAGDTVFLHRYADGWRIRAAGCRPDPPRPYDCEVEA
ncbi:hypothetical protein GCM10023259_017580 [Thermocatellispora tengchongensis]